MRAIRTAFILPGIGRVQRGAEAAFCEIARELTLFPDMSVELLGSGDEEIPGVPTHRIACIPRERFERWPSLPCLRNEYQYEELTFILSLALSGRFRPNQYDVTFSCSYPYVNWYLQATRSGRRPLNVFVTQNGDWPCREHRREFRHFRCDGLVCTNPVYYERNQRDYRCCLIPNGVNPQLFHPTGGESCEPSGTATWQRAPQHQQVVLMVSALISSKAVADGVRAVAQVPEAFLVVVGDGPERREVAELADCLLPGRHRLLGNVPRTQIPQLFRQADTFLHMSRDEPFGIVYLEAASSGLPIVVHDATVPRWILGDSALFVDTRNPSAVAGAIRHALRPEVRQHLGGAARERVLREWSWRAQAAKYRNFILNLMATGHRALPTSFAAAREAQHHPC